MTEFCTFYAKTLWTWGFSFVRETLSGEGRQGAIFWVPYPAVQWVVGVGGACVCRFALFDCPRARDAERNMVAVCIGEDGIGDGSR